MHGRLIGSACLAVALTLAQQGGRASEETHKPAPQSQGEAGRNESLSEKLDKQKGVITPKPGVDEPMVKPAPPPKDSMPVFRPPSTPGTEAK